MMLVYFRSSGSGALDDCVIVSFGTVFVCLEHCPALMLLRWVWQAASRLEGQARQMSDTRVDVLTQRIVAVFHSNNRSRPHLLDAAEPNNRSHRQVGFSTVALRSLCVDSSRLFSFSWWSNSLLIVTSTFYLTKGGKRLKVSGGGVQYDPRTGTWVQQPTVLSTEEAKVDSTQTQEKKPGHSSRYDVISEHARALQELQGAQATLNEAMSKTTDRENNLKSLQDRVAALQARVTELTDDVSAIKSLHNPRDSDLEVLLADIFFSLLGVAPMRANCFISHRTYFAPIHSSETTGLGNGLYIFGRI